MAPNEPTKVELYASIRRDARAGLSGRELQRTHHVGWRIVQAALASAWSAQRAPYPPRASQLDPFKPVIDQILVTDLDAPREQRHTITRIFGRLCREHGMTDVSYPVVRAYVARRRPEIRAEHGRADTSAFIPQTHLPGREAEVDFGEISVRAAPTCELFLEPERLAGSAESFRAAAFSETVSRPRRVLGK